MKPPNEMERKTVEAVSVDELIQMLTDDGVSRRGRFLAKWELKRRANGNGVLDPFDAPVADIRIDVKASDGQLLSYSKIVPTMQMIEHYLQSVTGMDYEELVQEAQRG